MARTKRREKINGLALAEIEQRVRLLRIQLSHATLSLTPFRPHYDAISELDRSLTMALNVLNDRPASYEEPYAPPLSGTRRM